MTTPNWREPLTTATATQALEGDAASEAGVPKLPSVAPERYAILGEVARGGVGRILRASDRRLERQVALKLLQDPSKSEARLVREALLTARLQHPAIIPVHEIGRFPSGEAFFAMKLVDGESLRDAIRKRANLEQRLELLPNVLAVADAMAYAHSERVIHRDIKPSNVLLGAFGETVVIDWGLAKDLRSGDAAEAADAAPDPVTSASAGEVTRSGAVMGTPVYMPPEQALGHPADERADVYALGALLYHVVTGAPPFEGATAAEVLERVLSAEPPRLAERAVGAPAELCAIVVKAMARSPGDRYADARAFAEDLHRFQLGQITNLPRGERWNDAALDAEFDVEARARALRPTRAIAMMALALIPPFALLEARVMKSGLAAMLTVRGVAEVLIALLLTASHADRGRRWSYEIGLGVILVVGAQEAVLNRLDNRVDALFPATLILVFLTCSTFLQMPSRKVVWALSLLTIFYLAIAATSNAIPLVVLGQQFSLFAAGVVIAAVGVRFTFGLQRTEFYNRRRLEQANERLAKL